MHSLPRTRRFRPALARLVHMALANPATRAARLPLSAALKAWRRWRSVRWLVASFLTALVAMITTVVVAYVRTPMPTEPQPGVTDEGSIVYYGDGRTPIFRVGANRQIVRHGQIPDRLRWAVLAAEDRGFYSDHGVSPIGTFRALWNNASGGETQGGSTVTQQLARNYFKGLSKDRSATRKFKEIFISIKLARSRAKEEILDLYLNTIYFGRDTSGVEAAARAYFDKDVWQLNVAECALLAAMIQRPVYFKTQGKDARARALRDRWRYVLDGMVAMGRLSRAEAARQRFPSTQDKWRAVEVSGQALMVKQRVLTELEAAGIRPEDVVNGRLKVYTGLDRKWMAYAEHAMRTVREPEWPAETRGGLIAVDPRDGAVRAFYGGDTARSQYDSVFNPVAQAGSTFKAYVLAAALRRGFTVRSLVNARSPQKFAPDGSPTPMTAPGYRVDNDEAIGSLGTVDLVKATALSVNTGYIKLAFVAGIPNVLRTAQDFGVPAAALKPFKGQAGVALGIPDVSAVDQAAGYAAFANGGTAVVPHLVTKVVDAHGRRIRLPWERRPRRRVLGAEQVAQATYALRATVTSGTGRQAALPDRPVAGKTGTTEHNHAAWFVGYVPQLSTAVVMANTKHAPLKDLPGFKGTVAGENLPTRAWHAFMEKVTRDMEVEQFPLPAFTGITANWDDSEAKDKGQGTDGSGVQPGTPGSTPSSEPRKVAKKKREEGIPRPQGDTPLEKWCQKPGNETHRACTAAR
ncbi:transglycosylase domain-containing protein [Actinomadura roseirufa]|uniref:transglycosylase domain-containing protein n=1 Tax=Actinomadura roseirufa TaxID=2094049 RepID=UPI00104155F7|nr:transglycosylase domain-containing protein [Actinomadura roseirufa]